MPSTWKVSPLTVVRPLPAVTVSVFGPGAIWPVEAPAGGTVATIWVSVHDVVAKVTLSSETLPDPLDAPNPRPLIVTERAVSAERRNGLDTENSCGAAELTMHLTVVGLEPGVPMLTPTWVGARSVGMVTPGIASNSVAIVRKRGL